MIKQEEDVSVKDIIKEFAEQTISGDMEKLRDLFHEDAIIEIDIDDNEAPKANKYQFLTWYRRKLIEEGEISMVEFDQCIHCNFGCPVILFNDGLFPIKPRSHNRKRSGILLEVKEGKITELRYCTVFLKTENEYYYDPSLFESDPGDPF